MTKYTTEEVRMRFRHGHMLVEQEGTLEAFDRWLAAHDKEVLDKAVERVTALEPLLSVDKWDGGYDCCGCSTLSNLFADAVTAVRGEGEQS